MLCSGCACAQRSQVEQQFEIIAITRDVDIVAAREESKVILGALLVNRNLTIRISYTGSTMYWEAPVSRLTHTRAYFDELAADADLLYTHVVEWQNDF